MHRVPYPFADRLDELFRDSAAGDLVFEYVSLARCRLNLEFDVAELTPTARLFLEDLFSGSRHRDRLAVCDLRFTDVRLDAEFAFHTVDDDLQMKLAHPGNDRLPGFVVGVDLERRVFLS